LQSSRPTARTRSAISGSVTSAKEKILQADMPLTAAVKPRGLPVRHNHRLDVAAVGRDETDAPDGRPLEDLSERQHRGAGGNPGRLADAFAKALAPRRYADAGRSMEGWMLTHGDKTLPQSSVNSPD
jgi:hypothetical protein